LAERVILGIDPGTNIMGYGVLEVNNNKPSLVVIGIVDLQKSEDHFVKLKKIFDRTISLIEQYHPDELAIEAPFFGKNIQSMLKLGRAQGTAISAALSHSIPIFEYAPRKIKMSITGQGNASKEQVAFMLQKMLGFKEMPKNLDATDGLAAAMCHFFQPKVDNASPGAKSWKEFISKNPGRIK
jgi:crossover junction endodeoxyribonuclease RuvC